MNERRQRERFRPDAKISVYNRGTNELFGYVADISPEGLMLIGENLPTDEGIYRLRLELPVEIDGATEITFDAESMWCKYEPGSCFNKAGFRLTNVSEKDEAIINKLVKTREFQSMAGYVPGRG